MILPWQPVHLMDEFDPNDPIVAYFANLGYNVEWDGRGGPNGWASGRRWYNLFNTFCNEPIHVQIDFGVPLSAIIEDMVAWAEGREATSSVDYSVRYEHMDRFNILLCRVWACERWPVERA
jgi:hypothetical protein